MSSTNDYEQFWREYDTGETDELHLTKSNLCHKMMSVVNDEKKKFIEFELNLHNFYFWIHSYVENIEGFQLNQIQQSINEFRQRCNQAVQYFEKRFNETPSLLNKSKYALGCWYLTNDSKHLINSIDLIIKSADDPNKEDIDQVYYLMSAFNLSRIYNFNQFNTRISDLALKFFYNFVKTTPRWMIEPVEIFVKLNRNTDHNLINNMISNLHGEAYKFFKNDNHHLHQSLLKVSIPLVELTNLDNSMKEKLRKEIQIMIAESNEDDAQKRWDKDEAMAAVIFFEKAKKDYELIGRRDKIEELNKKIRESTQDIQWKEIRMKFTMPELKLEGNNGTELVNSFCNCREKIPNLDRIEQQAKQQITQNPISTMFSKTTFSKKNPISHDSNDDSHLKSEMHRLTIWNIQLAENRLSLASKKLEEENKISAQDFIKFFEDRGLHDTEQLPILKSGIENHFSNDYIASIHTLIPQIEGTLRLVLVKKGIATMKTKRDIIMDNELGGILNKSEVREILGSDLTHYLKTKYTDPAGLNQRNEFSHALASISEFKHSTSVSLIHDLMILSTLVE